MEKELLSLGEYAAAGLYEEPTRGLFYRKALGLRRYYEHCALLPYRGGRLYPSGATVEDMAVRPYYLWGLTAESGGLAEKHPRAAALLRAEFGRYRSTVPEEHTVAGNMYTHSMPHYERVVTEGLLSYKDRIRAMEDRDMREGLLHLVDGICRYVERCRAYLVSVSADAALIAALERVPLYPATTAYEALVAWNFTMYLDSCDNLGCLASGLLPLFRGEDLVPVLRELYENLNENNGFSMALDSTCPALTVQCLDAAQGLRRPMIELFVDEETPSEVWESAIRLLKSGGGQPAFYNGRVLLSGLLARFPSIRKEDIRRFCGGGCTESMIAGLSNVGSLDAGVNLLLILERTLHAVLPHAASFEELYGAFLSRTRDTVEQIKREINRSRKERAQYTPLPMRTLLVDDCIDRGVEYQAGGARYNWSILNFAGLINVIDSLLAVKYWVFDQKTVTAEELLSRLAENDPALLAAAISLPQSFGRDGEEVNAFAHRVSRDVFSMTEEGEVVFGEGFLSASIQFATGAAAGKRVGATPDGRAAGAPLCDSLAAIFGKDRLGPTALLGSVTSLDLGRALGVPVLNCNVTRDFPMEVLRALILGYMQKGGIQMQITYASPEELLDALEHPERHGNLVVRVGGYSEYFNRLDDGLKKMVVSRTVHSCATS